MLTIASLLKPDRLRKLGTFMGVALAHLAVFAMMGRGNPSAPEPALPPPVQVFLYRPPPPPPPPPPVAPVKTEGGGSPGAASRIHVTPKPADKPRELPAPPVPAPVPDPVLVGTAPTPSPTPGMGQGGQGAGEGTGDGDGVGPGSGGTGPMILRGATSAEIMSVRPPPVRGVRRPSGRAVVNCVIRLDQRLDDCRVVEETPPGFGFGEQALRAMPFFRYRPPLTRSGRPVEGQRVTLFVTVGR